MDYTKLTDEELIELVSAQKELTELEAELSERLCRALAEVDRLAWELAGP